ncbi:acid protease [Mycena vulgaris]|nr:acid protease [Mycena vulgaris]
MRNILAALWTIWLAASAHARAEFHVVRHEAATGDSPAPAVIPKAEFFVPFTAKISRKGAKAESLGILLSNHNSAGKATTVKLAGVQHGFVYVADVTVGGQLFKLAVDTGSSDTWIPQRGFRCLQPGTAIPQPAQECGFGATFNPAKSKTFQLLPKTSFVASYGDGSQFVTGAAGFETVSIGGLSVTKQEIGLPNVTAWIGNDISSGLLGLAFPGLTGVYNTTDPEKASPSNQLVYNPFFISALQQKKVKNPYFSTALNRPSFAQQVANNYDSNLGYLAFGGIAPVAVGKTAVTVPIDTFSIVGQSAHNYFFYAVDVQAYTFLGSSPLTARSAVILDTGTTLNLIPDDIAAAYHAQFKPKAQYDAEDNLYIVDCKAKAPAFSVTIGGKAFTIDPRDQVIPGGTDDQGNVVCISGTTNIGQIGPGGLSVLGDTFLHNIVTTFDVVQHTVTITQRVRY